MYRVHLLQRSDATDENQQYAIVKYCPQYWEIEHNAVNNRRWDS